jgi:SnoaL-like domain
MLTSPGAHSGAVPADPARFVAEAERISNAANVEEALAVYAPDAVLESVTDGTLLVHRGSSELRTAIEIMFSVARTRLVQVRKELVAITDDTIVNTWEGTVGRRRETRGIEVWRFDTDGKVCHQRMYTFLDVRPDTDWVQRLRILLLSPRTALAFLRAQLRAG